VCTDVMEGCMPGSGVTEGSLCAQVGCDRGGEFVCPGRV